MHALEPLFADTRSYTWSDPELVKVVLNATSWFEASLALELLAETTPARSLVTAANIREAIKELPRCPMAMPVDFEGLARIWQLEREGSAWTRSFADEAGEFSIALLGEGNYCYDIVVRCEGRSLMWMPDNSHEDFLNPDVVELMMQRPALLAAIVDLLEAMGLPFCPAFYMSLEDWRQEYARTVFEEVVEVLDLTTRATPESIARTRAALAAVRGKRSRSRKHKKALAPKVA